MFCHFDFINVYSLATGYASLTLERASSLLLAFIYTVLSYKSSGIKYELSFAQKKHISRKSGYSIKYWYSGSLF